MQGVFSAAWAKFVELKTVRVITTILLSGVVTFFAVIALKCNHRANVFLLGSHTILPTFIQ